MPTALASCLCILLLRQRLIQDVVPADTLSIKMCREGGASTTLQRMETGYLAVEAQAQQHEEEERSPQIGHRHSGQDFRVYHKYQSRS